MKLNLWLNSIVFTNSDASAGFKRKFLYSEKATNISKNPPLWIWQTWEIVADQYVCVNSMTHSVIRFWTKIMREFYFQYMNFLWLISSLNFLHSINWNKESSETSIKNVFNTQ